MLIQNIVAQLVSGSQIPALRFTSFSERDLLALLLHVEEAREELLPLLDDEDVAHPGLRALLGALKSSPTTRAEALMADLPDEAERGLLAALLVDERQWVDTHSQVTELRKRYDIRRRKRRVRHVTQAIVQAQATGDAALPALEEELRSLQRDLQREAEAVMVAALGAELGTQLRPVRYGRAPSVFRAIVTRGGSPRGTMPPVQPSARAA